MKHTVPVKSTVQAQMSAMLVILLCSLSLYGEQDSTALSGNDQLYSDTAAILPTSDTPTDAPVTTTNKSSQSATTAFRTTGADTLLSANGAAPADSIPVDSSMQSGSDTLHEVSIGTVNDGTTAVATYDPDTGAPAVPSAEKSSSYSPTYQGMTRGIRTPVSRPLTAVSTEQPDSFHLQSTVAPELPAAFSDTVPVQSERPATATNAALHKLDKRTKIIVAAGTSAAILGTAVFILVKQFNDDRSQKDNGIPDPPAPPGYW